MGDIKYTNMSLPASFGVEWSAGEPANRHQLSNPRGTTTLVYGFKSADSDTWSTMTVTHVYRFGLTDPPTNFKEFMHIVRAYVEA